ncbi:hypothetical protein SOVF_005630 [Spinacia oleracea]|uniref:Uncharacterized protein n=1 Tax=Spinacia oleracea TaxID=3562 RepID=A0A9R0JJ90_SPIOL|nr:uncharacterized protein LOC110776119 [Spinacia oleracea]KNA25581.1 hypothetical protein SOVF_005630 [Spinacia oleracea]
MAARIVAAARQAASITRISSAQPPLPRLVQRRGFAGAAEHGPQKVNCWQEPKNPGNWKEEHFVIVSLTGWALAIGGSYKFFTRGKGKTEEKLLEASQ